MSALEKVKLNQVRIISREINILAVVKFLHFTRDIINSFFVFEQIVIMYTDTSFNLRRYAFKTAVSRRYLAANANPLCTMTVVVLLV